MTIVLSFLCDNLPHLHSVLNFLDDLVIDESSSHILLLKETGKTSLTILIDKFVLTALVPSMSFRGTKANIAVSRN